MSSPAFRSFDTTHPRIMVVDGSKVVRKMIEGVLRQALPDMEFVGCESGEEAKAALQAGAVNLVTTALRLPDHEIAECGFFALDALPEGATKATLLRLAELRGEIKPADFW